MLLSPPLFLRPRSGPPLLILESPLNVPLTIVDKGLLLHIRKQ